MSEHGGGTRRWPRMSMVAVLCAALVAAAGCGGEDDSTAQSNDDSRWPSVPAPALTPGDPDRYLIKLRERIMKAQSEADCRRVDRINSPGLHHFDCPVSRKLARDLRFFSVEGAQIYGSGGVVDYNWYLHDGVAAILRAAPDGRWAVDRFDLPIGHKVETSDVDTRDGYREVAKAHLDAIEARDCDSYVESLAEIPGEAPRDAAICDRVLRDQQTLGRAWGTDAKLDYLGGNGVLGFFGVYTDAFQDSWTISVMRDGEDSYGVIDALPSTLPNAS